MKQTAVMILVFLDQIAVTYLKFQVIIIIILFYFNNFTYITFFFLLHFSAKKLRNQE